MTKLYTLLLCLFSFSLSAQVCTTYTDPSGKIYKSIRFQTGKDTVVTGVSYQVADKLGMTIGIVKTKSENTFSFSLRTNDLRISDTLDVFKTSLVFTMANGDTIKVRSANKAPLAHIPRVRGAIQLFMSGYLTKRQMNLLFDKDIAHIAYCVDNNAVELAITDDE